MASFIRSLSRADWSLSRAEFVACCRATADKVNPALVAVLSHPVTALSANVLAGAVLALLSPVALLSAVGITVSAVCAAFLALSIVPCGPRPVSAHLDTDGRFYLIPDGFQPVLTPPAVAVGLLVDHSPDCGSETDAPVALAKPADAYRAAVEVPTLPDSSWTVAALKTYLASRGFKVPSKIKKAALLEMVGTQPLSAA